MDTPKTLLVGVSFPTINSWINANELKLKIDNILSRAKSSPNIFESDLFTRKDLYEDLLVKLTYHSDGIEGSTLTLRETASIILENINITNKTLIEQMEAKNHKSALVYLFEYIKEGKEINEKLLKRLHEILMNGILDNAGSYRYHPVRIVSSQTETSNHLKVPELIQSLFSEMHASQDDILTKVSIFHSKFEIIHPFPDGNGRVGRLLMNAMLIKENIIPVIIDKKNKNVYYNCLDKAFTDNEYDHMINFIVDSVRDTYEEFGV